MQYSTHLANRVTIHRPFRPLSDKKEKSTVLKRQRTLFLVMTMLTLLLALLLGGCAGEQGPPGPEGAQGPPGPQGPAGPPADSSVGVATYVGSEACGQCHEALYNDFILSGHPYKLNPVVDGQPPEPPEGYTWDDISYVIGGYGWKARFIDQDGYIITGDDENATTQYNLYNEDLEMGDNWGKYHAGEAELVFDCGNCHTTGYSDWPPDSHQDDRPGLIGTWAAPGIQCEACHGPASLHVSDPGNTLLQPEVNRDATLCAQCHIRGDVSQIDASGVFVQHHEQYEDFFQSKHRALTCVDCHNPHATTLYQKEAVNQGSAPGIVVECENCHWEQEQFQPAGHSFPKCVDCHMARLGKSALGDEDRLRGDIPSHLFAINPYADSQFYEDSDGNLFSEGYITIPYACAKCHYEDGIGGPVDLDTLKAFAQGYHDRPVGEP
jgi:hypothetical protein